MHMSMTSVQEHNQRLIQLLHRIRKYGLKFNRAKCLFGVTEITFLGDKLSGRSVEPDNSKIQAILDMPSPVDKKVVLRIMGIVNFIGKFIPNLSAITASLRELFNFISFHFIYRALYNCTCRPKCCTIKKHSLKPKILTTHIQLKQQKLAHTLKG